MRSCVFATNNAGKVSELKIMLQSETEVLTFSDLGLVFVPNETGLTFEENALQKSRETADFLAENGVSGKIVFADDSGLEIDGLDGAPGVDSALFMGADTPYSVRNAEILRLMNGLPDEKRTARFVCVIAAVLPCGEILTTRGGLEGRIARAQQGEGGFGYDPIFFLPNLGKTAAQLSREEKNKISHRGLAFKKMVEKLGGGL